jgi:transposase
MEHYAGIDVSLEQSSVCMVGAAGKIVREAKVASEPEALAGFFRQLGVPVTRIGLEAGPLSQWLRGAGLTRAGLEAVLLETRPWSRRRSRRWWSRPTYVDGPERSIGQSRKMRGQSHDDRE